MKRWLILILLQSYFILSLALSVPQLAGRINDYAGILTSDQEQELELMIREMESKTSSQVVLLTITSLEDEVLEDYSLRVAETWQIGQKEYDNGVLLLIALKEKKIRLEVGYGLESIITDAKSGYIIRNLIVPGFREGNYYGGISSGLTAITGLITAEFEISPEELARFQQQEKKSRGIQIPVGFIFFLLMIIFGGLGRRKKGGLLPLLFLGTALGRSSGRSSGFGGFGGFSGGGGSFGGGGASGGW